MTQYIDLLNGFLEALTNVSNHDLRIDVANTDQLKLIHQSTPLKIDKNQLEERFRLWLFNSTAEFFYDPTDEAVTYVPILDLTFWQSKIHFNQQLTFINQKMEQFFDIFEVDFLQQAPYFIYPAPFGGRAVIGEVFILKTTDRIYLLSLGWDD